jgi:uncharacterized protein YkwD
MTSKLSLALATASLLCLAWASNATALGISNQRIAERPAPRVATASTLIAPANACPSQVSLSAPPEAQERAMLCMTNFARANAGLGALTETPQLDQSARSKAEDVLSCDSFSHSACGRDFTYWIRQSGYIGEACWHAGENLAWGAGEHGSVRSIFRAWMNSPTHRANILGSYDQVGIGLLSGDLEGHPGAHVWAAHFGSRCQG